MEEQHRALYIISVAAELAGVHPQTLRIYERKGLIEPARTEGRSRRYSERDIALLQRIQELTNDGVSLAGVKLVLELEARLEAIEAERDEARAERDQLRRELREALEQLRRRESKGGQLVPIAQTVVQVRRSG